MIRTVALILAIPFSCYSLYLSFSLMAALGQIRRDYKKGGSIWKYNDSVFGTRHFKGSIFGEKSSHSLKSSKSTGITVRGRARK